MATSTTTALANSTAACCSSSMSLASILVGGAMGVCSALSLLINLVLLWVLLRSRLIRANPIYALSALNMLSDCLQNVGILCFLAPTSIAQSYLHSAAEPNQPIWLAFMLLFQFQWYLSEFILIAIAVNRLIVVTLPARASLISREMIAWTAVSIFPAAIVLTLIADFLMPCCRTNYSHALFSYQFFAWRTTTTEHNYKNAFIDLPLNIGTTLVLFACYGMIFLRVLQTNRKEVIKSSVGLAQSRRMGELRYALQFALISCFFIAAWVSFRVFPALVPKQYPEWYSLTTFFEICNCSANGIIYLSMNQEVRQKFVSTMHSFLGWPPLLSSFKSEAAVGVGAAANDAMNVGNGIGGWHGRSHGVSSQHRARAVTIPGGGNPMPARPSMSVSPGAGTARSGGGRSFSQISTTYVLPRTSQKQQLTAGTNGTIDYNNNNSNNNGIGIFATGQSNPNSRRANGKAVDGGVEMREHSGRHQQQHWATRVQPSR